MLVRSTEKYIRRHYRFFFKHHGNIYGVSRKTKKAILGRKLKGRKLKARLAAVNVTKNPYPQPADISDTFCPRCGCERTVSSGNMVYYPEVWEHIYCLRCGFLVGMADNSPYVHALEFPDSSYTIEW